MAMQFDPNREEAERKEYLEDRAYEAEQDREEREHELRMARLEQGTAARYRTVEKLGLTLLKVVPYCFAIMGLTVLSLAKRKIPSSLSDFITK